MDDDDLAALGSSGRLAVECCCFNDTVSLGPSELLAFSSCEVLEERVYGMYAQAKRQGTNGSACYRRKKEP